MLIIGWLYLNTEDIRKKSDELFKLENGSDRFVLLDERDFSIEVMKEKILEMIITTECQVIILDPVSDLFEDLPFCPVGIYEISKRGN